VYDQPALSIVPPLVAYLFVALFFFSLIYALLPKRHE
jgi:hypothetical protein